MTRGKARKSLVSCSHCLLERRSCLSSNVETDVDLQRLLRKIEWRVSGTEDDESGRRGVSCAFRENQVVLGRRALGVMELCQPTDMLKRGLGATCQWYLLLSLVLELAFGTQSNSVFLWLRS